MSPSKLEDLEKQLARDTLEKALKDIYAAVTQEIERNKNAFSDKIETTLEAFQESISQTLSDTLESQIDSQLPTLLDNHFAEIDAKINLQILSKLDEKLPPLLERAYNETQKINQKTQEISERAHETLSSWEGAKVQLWTKPFLLMFGSAILTGFIVSLFLSYLLLNAEWALRQSYADQVLRCERICVEYLKKEEARESSLKKGKSDSGKHPKTKARS